jgi:signal transduction histidine kinase
VGHLHRAHGRTRPDSVAGAAEASIEHRADIVDRLAALPLFADVPRAELAWLAARGEVRACAAGTILLEAGAVSEEMYVVLAGSAAVYVNKGGVWRNAKDSGVGEVLGVVPYSRLQAAPVRLVVEADASLLALGRANFPELIRDCPALTSALVHEMIDRARVYRAAQLHDERLQSLGRLASGLAHELNNPASAASRSAQSLAPLLEEAESAARALTRARLSDEQLDVLEAVRASCATPAPALGAIDLADREDLFADWLSRHGIELLSTDALAASEVEIVDLERLAAAIPKPALDAALRWVAAGCAARALSEQIATATGRIHDLVAAVKRFTFMDRQSVPANVDVAQGLADTLIMLENKSRTKAVETRLELAPDLPSVFGFGSEINQVWEKLVDNAIDAAGIGGHVAVVATWRDNAVFVSVTDDGAGIAEKHQPHVFEPFFTTKPVGQGTGLGLDLVRRVVHFHHGDVTFTSEPGRTVFRVQIPVSGASAPSPPNR